MANAVQPSFAPVSSGVGVLSVQQGEQGILALPGTGGDIVRIVNFGQIPAFVLLGVGSSLTVTSATGMCVMPGDTLWLTQGSDDHIVAIGSGFGTAMLNIAVGN